MFAHWARYKFTQYVVEPIDPQIYNVQIKDVEEMIKRPPRGLPTVILNPKEKREHLWDYRSEDFELLDYNPHPKMRIDALT
jgi:thymidylate synthase